ncbi:MAG: diguanylate cyclase (GGDEF) domain-containing protein [Candidatus Electronema aureum]|uniref:diguanylate cyclase n=1 Tax=Candidatus Electronema aureum TaxID=2005002 RepID=A0A521G0D6_9BACT|nr:MAG: diguanylate cyclase (GGDEF) domain-containing protein [Candidatus Electronema aureum]
MISRIRNWVALHCRHQQGKLNMRLSVSRTISKNKKLIICLSLIIFVVNTVFLSINFYSLRETLLSSLFQQAKRHEEEFKLNLKMVYSSMLQMSTLISSSGVSQAFLLNKKQTTESKSSQNQEAEDSSAGQKTYQFGSVENKPPHLLSDKMQGYTWLRGISPLWAVDPETNGKIYVGAMDISTSFKDIVPLYAKLFQVEAAVLLNKDYIRTKMWNKNTKEYFEQHPEANHYVEIASSWDELLKILPKVFVRSDYKTDAVSMVYQDKSYYALYYFALPDSQDGESEETQTEPAGFMLIWENVSEQVSQSATNFFVNILLAIFGFVLIEIGLIWVLNRETRLSVAEQCAAIDELTGLFNRRYLDDLLDNELRRTAKSQDTPLSLIICDVDYFKRYNDTYGHKSGDDCLKKIADSLRLQARRSSDCVARYGGEEFVIVLPRTDLHSATDIAEAARKAILALNIPHSSSDIVPVITITLGVACTSTLAEYDTLFEAADRNLYIAKNNGRNRVEPTKVALPPRRLV